MSAPLILDAAIGDPAARAAIADMLEEADRPAWMSAMSRTPPLARGIAGAGEVAYRLTVPPVLVSDIASWFLPLDVFRLLSRGRPEPNRKNCRARFYSSTADGLFDLYSALFALTRKET